MAILDLAKAKLMSGQPNADDTLMAYQIAAVQEDIRNIANCDYFNMKVRIAGNVAFDSTLNRITFLDSNVDLIEEGFLEGMTIQVLGSANNNRLFTISALTQTTIDVDDVELLEEILDDPDTAIYVVKVEWPQNLIAIAADMIRYKFQGAPNAHLSSKKYSRLAVSYNNSASSATQGYPAIMVGGIRKKLPQSRNNRRLEVYNWCLFYLRPLSIELDWDYFKCHY